MTRKIALIGHGAIAREIIRVLRDCSDTSIGQVMVRPGKANMTQSHLPEGTQSIDRLDDLAADTDFVLECAGHEAVGQFGPACLGNGLDFGVLSVGALAEPEICDALLDSARFGQAGLVVVPGAIGGIDALSAAGSALEEVAYTARKPPLSWAGSPAEESCDLAAITEPTAVFEGTARAAALAFPRNANVVATVALAGLGFEQTKVTLFADPDATGNSHRIRASGGLFDLDYFTQGAALPGNPRTSALTAFSAVRAIRHRSAGLRL